MRFRIVSLIVVSAVIAFFLHREHRQGGLDHADRVFLDWLVANSSERIKEPEITFIRLDDEEHRIFESWPLSQLDYAVILKNLERYSPDVIMVVPTLEWVLDDEVSTAALRTQLLRVPQVLLGCILEDNPVNDSNSLSTDQLREMLQPVDSVEGDSAQIPAFTGVLALPEKEFLPGNEVSFTHIDLGPANPGDALKVPLLARKHDLVVPSFILHALLIQNEREAKDVAVRLGDAVEIAGTDLVIPIDHAGYLNVFGGIRDRMPRLEAGALFLADGEDLGKIEIAGKKEPSLDTLKENIVLIGEDHPGARQIHIGKNVFVSRAELLALAIATIQSNRYISKLAPPFQYLVWGAIILVGISFLRLSKWRIVISSLLLLVVFLIASLILFQSRLTWIPPVIPVALILTIGAWGAILPRYAPAPEPKPAEKPAPESNPGS